MMLRALLVFFVMAAASCGTERNDSTSEVTRAREAFDEFIYTLNNLEWDRFQALIGKDVTVFNPAIPSAPSMHLLEGRGQVLASFESVFEAGRHSPSGPVQMVPENVGIAMYADAAVVTFEFERGPEAFGRR